MPIAAVAAAIGLGAGGLDATARADEPAPPVTVQVRADSAIARLEPGALGAVIWNPDAVSGDREVPRLIREAGIDALSWESGPAVDLYDWRTNSLKEDPGAGPSHVSGNTTASGVLPYTESLKPNVSFDRFGQIVRESGAQTAMAYVNYGTGTPEEAAGFVDYANNVKHYGVKYWEIGENNFLNGYTIPGLDLAVDGHADKSPTAFATNALELIQAMKEADPTIKVGVTLFASDALPFNDTVLRILAPHLDFVDLQVFAGRHLPDAQLLRTPRTVAARFTGIRALLDHYAPGRHVEQIVGETTSSVEPGAQQVSFVNALFLPDHLLSMYEGGVSRAFWFAFELGLWDTPADVPPPWTPNSASIFGYGDYGLLSSGQCDADNGSCEPPAHTPFPVYYGMQMAARLARSRATLLTATSSDDLVRVHAARGPGGRLSVMVINQDPAGARTLSLDLLGARRGAVADVQTFAAGDARPSEHPLLLGPHGTTTLAPYSITTLTFHVGPEG